MINNNDDDIENIIWVEYLHEDGKPYYCNKVTKETLREASSDYIQWKDNELEKYLIHLPEELAHEVTSILMNEEREVLHKWELQQIFVKQKEETISQYVTETIITLRWYLVNNIIDDLKNNLTAEEEQDNRESLEMVMAYLGLTHIFSKRLGRVLSRYH